jgi:hypothetical protein
MTTPALNTPAKIHAWAEALEGCPILHDADGAKWIECLIHDNAHKCAHCGELYGDDHGGTWSEFDGWYCYDHAHLADRAA